ncbi:MAG: hypothetical protein LBQ28_02260 [Prevotellaceae bacterium]|jgi:hypothetical protein|nr:hypothetical protein [Prevotellaceae bacterium]
MKNLVVVEFITFLPAGFVSAQARLAREITCLNSNQQMFFNELKTLSILGCAALNILSLAAKFSAQVFKIYRNFCKIYSTPCKVYSTPCKVYSTPCKVCSTPCKVYSTPCKVYSTPCKVYSTSCKVYSTPCKVYSTPCKVYSTPCKVYSTFCKYGLSFLNILYNNLKTQKDDKTRLHPAI